jgi:hypothetical protein
MVISCDAKMIRSDTQIDYVGGNANEARPTGTLSVLLDFLIKSSPKKIPLFGAAANTKKHFIISHDWLNASRGTQSLCVI